MVIELKGSNANLDKPQNRKADKRTPVDKAFDYAKRSGDIDWIFVSNYNEFRLYNWHKKEHLYMSSKLRIYKIQKHLVNSCSFSLNSQPLNII